MSKIFVPYQFKFVINKYRKDKDKRRPFPVKRSRYAQQLWGRGAGWGE